MTRFVRLSPLVGTVFGGGAVEGRTIALDTLKKKPGEITSSGPD